MMTYKINNTPYSPLKSIIFSFWFFYKHFLNSLFPDICRICWKNDETEPSFAFALSNVQLLGDRGSLLEWVVEECNPCSKKLLLTRFKDIEERRTLRYYIIVQTFLIFWESGTRVILGLGFVDSYLSFTFLWDRNNHHTSLWASVMGIKGALLCLILERLQSSFLEFFYKKILFPIVIGWVDSLSTLCLYSIDHSNEISFQMFEK